jgi:tetratricopeptide (TPR) repeat protein
VAVPLLLALFSGTKAVSYFLTFNGERSLTSVQAIDNFALAARLDPDNPGADLGIAEVYAREKDWAASAPYYRRAIDRGLGVSIMYSFLANAQERSGDVRGAENTLKEAAAIFPRSTFLHARLALVQDAMNNGDDSERTMQAARSIDEKQANGWYFVIRDGVAKAHARSERNSSMSPPRELLPAAAIYAYSDEKFGPAPSE